MSLNWIQDDNSKKWFASEDNVNILGWKKDNEKWYHLNDNDGSLDTGFFQTATNQDHWFFSYSEKTEKDGDTHYVGEMSTGWIEYKGSWYYLYPQETGNYGIKYQEGAMATNWVKLGDKQKWYYLLEKDTYYNGMTYSKGSCVCNTILEINGQNYSFDKNGVWQLDYSRSSDSLVSDSLVSYVAGWESGEWSSESENAYEDPYYPGDQRYWTIGYGTCYCAIPEAFPNGLSSTCTQDQALGWLKQEINLVANTIKSALGDNYNSISQQAFDCLCDIGYNAGTGAVIGGNTWKAIISGDSDLITTKLMSWNKANGVVSSGLTKRCESRVEMCLNGVYNSDH